MITAITFQFKYNKKYLNERIQKYRPIGDQYTTDLEQQLRDDSYFMLDMYALIKALNADLLTCEIEQKIKKYLGESYVIRITKETKHKRKYYVAGLTIHEHDQVNAI